MNKTVVRVVVTLALLAVLVVTLAALRESDTWRRPGRKTNQRAEDPYQGLARLLTQPANLSATPVRDPFRPASLRPTTTATRPMRVAPTTPVQPQPVLTAILSDDADPRAVIRHEGGNYTVGAGGLFADYRVVSVSADAVTLERGGQQLVLRLPKKGD
jgi:hypothetical protein